MQRLDRADIPKGYDYYRSHSATYFAWIAENVSKSGSIPVVEEGYGGVARYHFWKKFLTLRFEKSDFVPDEETFQKYDCRHGVAFWSGWRKSVPEGRGWFRLPYWVSHLYHHCTRSAFSVLEPEYWKKWGSGPRGHRNGIRRKIESGEIRIDDEASVEDFLAAYEKTPLPHGWKRYLTSRQKFLSSLNDGNIRIHLAFVGGEPLAGAVFLDDFPSSTYLIAFQHPKAKKYHLGLAIVDRWFETSLEKGFEVLDFDHMRDRFDPSSGAGYTDFKAGIADYDLRFDSVWFRFFRST